MKRNGRKSLAGALARAKNESGFTLVELIVVIAILGILAGVGTVGYSGYIKKANMAADEILLDSLNTAFAAACIENGVDASTLADDSVSETMTDGKVTAVSMYNDEFVKYFGEGVNSEFKVFTDLTFKNGRFEEAGGSRTFTYKGQTVVVSQATLDALQNSTYKTIGANNLLDQIASVAGIAAYSYSNGGTFEDVMTIDYLNAVAQSVGYTDADAFDAYLFGLGFDDDKIDQVYANSLVLSAASATAGMDAETAINNLKNDPDTYIADIKSRLGNAATAEDALSDAALIYGVYTSYIYATDPENAATKVSGVNGASDLISALTEMQSADFEEYMSEGSGQDDLKAYLEAMKVIDSAASDSTTKLNIIQNGFEDEELKTLLQGVMG